MTPQIKRPLFFFRNFSFIIFLLCLVSNNENLTAQSIPQESDYYPLSSMNIPGDIVLEASGLTFNEEGQLAVTTRRGEVWLITDPHSENPGFERFGQGLHEPLGIAYRNGAYYIAQRGELVRLEDTNHDGRADVYKTIYRWPLS